MFTSPRPKACNAVPSPTSTTSAAGAQAVERSETLDPAQHSWTVLASFLEGLQDTHWHNQLDRRIDWERQAVEVSCLDAGTR